MHQLIYSTAKPVKRKRKRLGEVSHETKGTYYSMSKEDRLKLSMYSRGFRKEGGQV